MEPVQKSRRERWTAEAVKALQKAVETHLRGDNDVNWAGVARELGTTADRVKKKWRKLLFLLSSPLSLPPSLHSL